MVNFIDLDDPIEVYEPYAPPINSQEVIELTDEVEEVVDIAHVFDSSIPVTNNSRIQGKTSGAIEGKSILDLGNWVSSDEESFHVSLLHSPARSERSFRTNPDTSSHIQKSRIPSSPILAGVDAFDSHFSRTIASLNPSSPHVIPLPNINENEDSLFVQSDKENTLEPNSYIPTEALKKRKYSVLEMSSDPIQNSSQVSATPVQKKPKATKKAQVDPNDRSTKAWKDANKVIRRKQDILSEMIIEIPLCLEKRIETDYFRSIFLLPQVRSSYLEVPLISWKRRVTAKYDKSEDVFVPCDLTEITERVLVLFYEPEDLINKLKSNLVKADIEKARNRATTEDPSKDYFICIMVPGFNEYLRKLQTKENRQYRARTLQQLHPTQRIPAPREEVLASATEASRLLVESEVKLGTSIFTTKTLEESIDWLHSFTYTIGSSLYDKYERNPTFANIGVSRSGSNAKGSFLEMVKKFNLMTEPKAEYLFQYYSSPLSLFKRFMKHGDLGAVQGRNIVPPSVNKIMNKVFTCDDPDAVITD